MEKVKRGREETGKDDKRGARRKKEERKEDGEVKKSGRLVG